MGSWTREDVKRAVAESTERSGVPYHLEDPSTLRRIATMTATPADREAAA